MKDPQEEKKKIDIAQPTFEYEESIHRSVNNNKFIQQETHKWNKFCIAFPQYLHRNPNIVPNA